MLLLWQRGARERYCRLLLGATGVSRVRVVYRRLILLVGHINLPLFEQEQLKGLNLGKQESLVNVGGALRLSTLGKLTVL